MEQEKKSKSSRLNLIVGIASACLFVGGIASLVWENIENKTEEESTNITLTMEEENHSTLQQVMFEQGEFYDCRQGKTITLKEMLAGSEITEYTLVDMTQDGEKELVLHLEREMEPLAYVLLQNEQGVWGVEFSGDTMEAIYANGIYRGINDALEEVYCTLQVEQNTLYSRLLAKDTGVSYQVLEQEGDELKEVSRTQYTKFIREKCGTTVQGYRVYQENELRADLENPESFLLVQEETMDEDELEALISELPQYNDDMGATYEELIADQEEFYSEEAKWMQEVETVFHCVELENTVAIGKTESVYDSECALLKDDQVIMVGARMETKESKVSEFLLDGKSAVEPAVFEVPGQNGQASDTDALVWSCEDTFLVVFTSRETRKEPFYHRPAKAVCYVMKAQCGVVRYPMVEDDE